VQAVINWGDVPLDRISQGRIPSCPRHRRLCYQAIFCTRPIRKISAATSVGQWGAGLSDADEVGSFAAQTEGDTGYDYNDIYDEDYEEESGKQTWWIHAVNLFTPDRYLRKLGLLEWLTFDHWFYYALACRWEFSFINYAYLSRSILCACHMQVFAFQLRLFACKSCACKCSVYILHARMFGILLVIH